MLKKIFVIPAAIALVCAAAYAQKYTGSPVTKDRLVRAVKSRQFAVPILVKQIRISGVDFELTRPIETELRSARAHEDVIAAVRTNYRYAGIARGGTSGRNAPLQPDRDVAGERYEELYYQALATLNQLRTATSVPQASSLSRTVIDLGNQAIRANPARPEAYTLVGSAFLITRNFTEAERYGQSAIDRGGSLAFPVYHLAGQPHLEVLHVGSGFVTVESDQKFFQFNGREISNPRQEQNYFIGTVSVATFSVATYKNGRSDIWHFSPGNTGTPGEAQLIINLVRKNSLN